MPRLDPYDFGKINDFMDDNEDDSLYFKATIADTALRLKNEITGDEKIFYFDFHDPSGFSTHQPGDDGDSQKYCVVSSEFYGRDGEDLVYIMRCLHERVSALESAVSGFAWIEFVCLCYYVLIFKDFFEWLALCR